MHHTWHQIAIFLGLTNASGPSYLFYSGIGSDLAYLSALALLWRKLSCHADGCHRLGLHHVHGTTFVTCRKHHPAGGNSAADIQHHALAARKQ